MPVSELDPRPAHGFAPDPTPLRFDLDVAAGGYAWWYLDAVSDDGQLAVTVIAFVGSVFSPRYAAARRSAATGGPAARAEQFAAINVAVYRRDGGPKLWVMNEHASVHREAASLTIGRTRLRWDRDDHGQGPALVLELDEHETRFFARRGPAVRGRIRLRPAAVFGPRIELDRQRAGPRHRWYPVAPHARVEVELDEPALRFSGSGYHDVNEGDEPLEAGFVRWNWSRAALDERRTAILYDVDPRGGTLDPRGWLFEPERRAITPIAAETLAPERELPATPVWRVARAIRSEPGHPPRVLATLEDTPFYSRNLIAARIAGRDATAVHESLDCERFANRGVQFLLGFKTRAEP